MSKFKNFVFASLWQAFVWLDWTIRAKEFPKTIELTDRKDIVRINGVLCGFYSKEFAHHEICEEINDEDWKKYYSPDRTDFSH